MQYYTPENRAIQNAAKNAYPADIHIPLNLNRIVADRMRPLNGSFVENVPNESVSLKNWFKDATIGKLLPSHTGVTITSANTSLDTKKDSLILAGAGTSTLTLSPVAESRNKVYTIMNRAGGNVTVDGYASEQIEGGANTIVADGNTIVAVCDGTEWYFYSAT